MIGDWPPVDYTGFILNVVDGPYFDWQFENGFILSSELSIESKFYSPKFVELGLDSSHSSESESIDFDSANLDISVLSRPFFVIFFWVCCQKCVVIIEL